LRYLLTVLTGLIAVTLISSAYSEENEFPKWVNHTIEWYQEGKISEIDFVNALEFLHKKEIINLGSEHAKTSLPFHIISDYQVMSTNNEKHLVDLNKIKSGGPPPDGIPSIDQPKFIQSENAEFVSDNDIVIGVNINGEIKAYPLSIMTWHEIVNDYFGELPVAVTYCPLCFTHQVFERTIDGKVVEFGTSGKLYNSNLVMYDRMTNSFWSQSLGYAIKGEKTGEMLKTIPFDVMKWKDWKKQYPDTLVLSTETGHGRPYSSDPYSDYFKDPRVLFPVSNEDDRLEKKVIIVGVQDRGVFKAYPQAIIEQQSVINDRVGSKNILLVSTVPHMARIFDRTVDGQILDFEFVGDKIIDTNTQSVWNIEGEAISGDLEGFKLKRKSYHPGFWFEWVAFHPQTGLYQKT